MAETRPLSAHASVVLPDPAAMLRQLCAEFGEHGRVVATPEGTRLEGRYGEVTLAPRGDRLDIAVISPDDGHLFLVKSSMAEQLVRFSGEAPILLDWQGDGRDTTRIPYFHLLRVAGARQLTPAMRRVTLACEDAGKLATGGLHVRLLIPPEGRAPVWPRVGRDGRVTWAEGDDALTSRIYTIRSLDLARGEIEIDVVLHEDSAGSVWARQAKSGDLIGVMGPGGGEVPESRHYLLCGDETALPVIARIAEALPEGAQATIRIEVANAAEEQPIASKASLDLVWLHRDGAAAGTTDLIESAVRQQSWTAETQPYVLVGCEQRAARAIRTHLRKERHLPRERHLVAAYWRRGAADTHDHGE